MFGVLGVIGMLGVNILVCDVDFVIGIGMCYSDFIMVFKIVFVNLNVCFININVVGFDVFKYGVIFFIVDVCVILEFLGEMVGDYCVLEDYVL